MHEAMNLVLENLITTEPIIPVPSTGWLFGAIGSGRPYLCICIKSEENVTSITLCFNSFKRQ